MLAKGISFGNPVGESGILSETRVAMANVKIWGNTFPGGGKRHSKAERQDEGGSEQEDMAQCGEVERPDCLGFVGQGKEFGLLPSVGC